MGTDSVRWMLKEIFICAFYATVTVAIVAVMSTLAIGAVASVVWLASAWM